MSGIADVGEASRHQNRNCQRKRPGNREAHTDLRVARAFGDVWIREERTAVLLVPSVVARREMNVLLNPT